LPLAKSISNRALQIWATHHKTGNENIIMAVSTLKTSQNMLTDTLTPQAEARLIAFTKSELFAKTFREGMDLVEETKKMR